MPERHSGSDNPDARPIRRTFAAEYKAQILAEYDAAPDAATRGAILRREKLYGSHILDWSKARDAGAAAGLTDRRLAAGRVKESAEAAELARLRRQNARLEAELAETGTKLGIIGQTHALARHGIALVGPLLADHSAQGRQATAWTPCTQYGNKAIVATFTTSDYGPCPARPLCITGKRRQLSLPPRELAEAQTTIRAAEHPPGSGPTTPAAPATADWPRPPGRPGHCSPGLPQNGT